jgi:hypothetical protein
MNSETGKMNQVQWCISEILAFESQRQDDPKFQARLSYTARPCLKTNANKQRKGTGKMKLYTVEVIIL